MDKGEEIVISGLIIPIIKDIVIPKIKSIIEKFGEIDIDEKKIGENFDEYLTQRYEKYLIIDTLVFPNAQTDFRLLYEPLTVVSKGTSRSSIEILIDSYPADFLPKFIRVIIEDTAGMGKSTITKKIFLSAIEQKMGIPILIELRQINKENNFLQEIHSQLSRIGKEMSMDFILNLIAEGEFIFLFDGFDEIAKTDRDFVIKDLHKFIEKANNNYFMITSRAEDSLVSFGDFKKFYVKPLHEKEAFNLIRRYDKYSYKPIAKELIKKLSLEQDDSLTDFLSNPFLVSLLYKSFEFKKDIPQKKSQFYRQVFDALFESHDLSKEGYFKRDKYSNLHIDDFETVLRHISFLTSKENKVEYNKDYIINIINQAKAYTPELKFKSSDYLKDLSETVPLFKKEGDKFKWAHKSLQDYFTAKFLWIDARDRQEAILRKIYDDPSNNRFYNVIDLFYEMAPKVFENTMLLWLLEDFKLYTEDYNDDKIAVHVDILNKRKEIDFCSDYLGFIIQSDENAAKYNTEEDDDRASISGYVDHLFSQVLKNRSIDYIKFVKIGNTDLKYFLFGRQGTRQMLLRFLHEKIGTLVSKNTNSKSSKVLKGHKLGSIYDINPNIRNPINSKDNFELVTDLIPSSYKINYNNALDRLDKIHANRNKHLEDKLLDW